MVGRTGQKTITVGTSPVLLSRLMPNNKRIQWTVINTSPGDQIVWISIGQQATTQGYKLYPTGNYYEQEDSTYKPTNEDIFAVSDSADATINIIERVV